MCILVNMRNAMLIAIRTQQATSMPNVVIHIDGASGFKGSWPAGGAKAGHDELMAVAVSSEHSRSNNRSSRGLRGVMLVQ
jgi:hypothetical protein